MAGDEKPPGYRGGALTKRRRSKWKVKKLTRVYPPWRATTRLPAPYYADQDVYHNGRALTHVSAEAARQETCVCDDGRSCEACQVWLIEVQLNVRRECPHNDPWHLPSSMWRPYPWQAQSRCAYRDSCDSPDYCSTIECPLCGDHLGRSDLSHAEYASGVAGAVGGCKEPTVEAYLDADETCVCGETPWVQMPGGCWYDEASLGHFNLNGEASDDPPPQAGAAKGDDEM